MGKEYPRKVLFIDKKFQSSFILKFIALILVGTVVFNLAAYYILNRKLEGTLYSAHITIKSVGEMLLPVMISLSGVFILVLGAAVLFVTLIVSHQVAGPLYAIRRYMENIGEGKLDFVARLRSKDQTTPLAIALSGSLDVLNEKLASIRELAREVRDGSDRLKDKVQDDQPAASSEIRSELERITALGDKLVGEIEFFKTREKSGQS